MPDSIRFDRFALRVQERVLYLDGQPTALGGRAMALLVVLAQRHGRLVTKAELMELVWPGLVVEENNLQVQVSALRKVLGTGAIVTVPGRGYRFVLPLLPREPGAASVLAAATLLPSAGASSSQASALQLPPVRRAQAEPVQAEALTALPAQAQRLWGRERDLAALDALLPAPLITLVGSAGIGKTALALAAAHRWRADRPDGTAWVDLANLNSAGCAVTAVSQALGLSVAGADRLASLATALGPLKVLLVLDNAEHVLEAVTGLVRAVMQAAPGVRLLVTSQVPLKVDGERVFRLGPLSIPPPGASVDEALQHGAVALFVDQVRALDRRHELLPGQVALVCELCRRVDGLALAIKLAASRVPLLGLPGVVQRLDERFRLLAGHSAGVPDRHQTLMAALDWSHELLTPPEQALFRRVAVFAGGFPLSLVTLLGQGLTPDTCMDEWQVLDTLGALVDRSLVAVDGGDAPRYRLLDSMRDYASIKLRASGEQALLQAHHARAVAELMDGAYEAYWLSADATWLGQFGCDIDNVRVALDWAVARDPHLAVRLQGAVGPLFLLLGLAPEGRLRGRRVEALADSLGEDPAVARFWLEHSRLHWGVDNAGMLQGARRAEQASRSANDARGVYLALRCVAGSGMLARAQAVALLREMGTLERPDWPVRLLTQRLMAEVGVLRSLELMADARRVCQNLLVRAQSAGLEGVTSAGLSDLAAISLALGDTDAAWRISQDILARGRHRRDNFVVHALAIVACVAFVRADLAQARATLRDFLDASRSRSWEWLGLYAGLLALLAAMEGRHEAAARLLGYTAQTYRTLGSHDVLAVYAWSRAHAAVEDALEPTVLQRLLALGATLDPDAVGIWALGQTPA